MRYNIITTLILFATLINYAFADAVIQPLKTDSRAKIVSFNPNEIYSLKTNYLISTDVILGEDEEINGNDIHLGDASAWDIDANHNHLYIKAKKVDAAGNLNVTTNKYAYHFILSVAQSNQGATSDTTDQTLFLKFIYPAHDEVREAKLALEMVSLPADVCRNKSKYNMQYSYTGDKEQAPIQACDDGVFTYLKFKKHLDFPAIFMVLPNLSEQVVNYRMEKNYVVIERVAKAFTLRNGPVVTSVYNDKYIGDWNRVR